MMLTARTLPLVVSALTLSSSALAAPKKTPDLKSEKDKVSYILGHQIGSNFKRSSVDVNTDIFVSGLQEALAGKNSSISADEAQKIMTAFQASMQTKMEAKNKEAGAKNQKEGKAFLAENGKKPGVVTLPSGLQYKVIKAGAGASPKADDTVTTHYKGTLLNGTEFDSSYKRGEPATFPVSGVIKGWTEALQLMNPGAKWQLFIPSELAYGARGAGNDIGPDSALVFEVELISVAAAKAADKKDAPKPDTKVTPK